MQPVHYCCIRFPHNQLKHDVSKIIKGKDFSAPRHTTTWKASLENRSQANNVGGLQMILHLSLPHFLQTPLKHMAPRVATYGTCFYFFFSFSMHKTPYFAWSVLWMLPHRDVKQQKGRTIGGTVLTPWSERCFLRRPCRLMVAKWWLWGPWEGGRYPLKLLTLLSAISEGTGCKVQKMTTEKAANRNKRTVRMPKCNGLHFF